MCMICVDFDRGSLKVREARRALGEMREKLEPGHVAEIEAKLAEAEAKAEADPDSASG